MKRINGNDIDSVGPHYEQIGVRLADGSYVYMKYSDLIPILHEFIFDAETKKTRTWLHPVTPDVDLLYHPENYP